MNTTRRFDRSITSIDSDLEPWGTASLTGLVHKDPTIAMGVMAPVLILEGDVAVRSSNEGDRIWTEIILLGDTEGIGDIGQIRLIKPFEFDFIQGNTIMPIQINTDSMFS